MTTLSLRQAACLLLASLSAGACTAEVSSEPEAELGEAASPLPAYPLQTIISMGVFRKGQWLVDTNRDGVWTNGVDRTFVFGQDGDQPVVGDWRADGHSQCAGVYRPSVNKFYLDRNCSGAWDDGDTIVDVTGVPKGSTAIAGNFSSRPGTELGFTYGMLFSTARYWVIDSNGDGVFNSTSDAGGRFGYGTDVPFVMHASKGGAYSAIAVMRNAAGTPGQVFVDDNRSFFWDAGDVTLNWDRGGKPVSLQYRRAAFEQPFTGNLPGVVATYEPYLTTGFFIVDVTGNGSWDGTALGADVAQSWGLSTDVPVSGMWGY